MRRGNNLTRLFKFRSIYGIRSKYGEGRPTDLAAAALPKAEGKMLRASYILNPTTLMRGHLQNRNAFQSSLVQCLFAV